MQTGYRQLFRLGLTQVLASDTQTQLFPVNPVETIGHRRVEYMLYLSAISGAPTTAKLTAKLQKAIADTGTNEYANPLWEDFSDYDVSNRCLGGAHFGHQDTGGGGNTYARSTTAAPGTIHDSSVSGSQTLGYFVTACVTEPFDLMRIQVAPTFSGGTSPSYSVSGLMVVKY